MRQIPVVRGTKDTDALDRAMTELRGGSCVGIFPEGTRSLGRQLRARSGVGRLAAAVPEAKIVCASVTGTTDIPRFPKRPRLKVVFFEPRGGQMRPGEDPTELAVRIIGGHARARADQRGGPQAEADRGHAGRGARAREDARRGAHPARGQAF